MALNPPLTTLRQPIEGMGREMARMLIEVLRGGRPSPVILPTQLVIRQSA